MHKFNLYMLSTCAFFTASFVGQAFAADAPASAPSPYQLSVIYTGEDWNNAKGGLRTGNSYMNNLDAKLSIDADKAFGLKGGQFVLEGFYENSISTQNKFVGAIDEQSPIDAGYNKPMYRLYQAYYDQNFGKTDVRLGIYDLESEFSTTKPMSLFLSKDLTWNTAFDESGRMPQNGVVGPGNYPYTPLAVRVRQELSRDWSVQAVVANGASDNPNPTEQQHNGVYIAPKYGALGIAEVDYTPSKHTKIMVGTWGMDGKLTTNNELYADSSRRSAYGQEGGYAGAATRLYTPNSKEANRGLDGFFTFGYSNPKDTPVAHSLNGGLVYAGLFDARPHDKIGLSFNVNEASGSFQRATLAGGTKLNNYEPSFEATYRAKLNEWLNVQPDVQYIINPAYSQTTKNDLIVGVHFEIGHLFNL